MFVRMRGVIDVRGVIKAIVHSVIRQNSLRFCMGAIVYWFLSVPMEHFIN